MINILLFVGISGISCRLYLHYITGARVCLREVPSLEIARRVKLNLNELT